MSGEIEQPGAENAPQPNSEQAASAASDFPIVAIGASAGGLESLERFFSHIPPDTGMAFVVLQHLSPDFKSLMNELLGRRTAMAILHAETGMPVKPNTVYLLPPMKEMIISGRQLLLSDRDPRHGLTLPIDMFFRSLAQDVGNRARAVVLSGSGSDGSRGLQEVSRAGGVVFCETPDTAQFNGMPLSAMRTGMVDHVLPPEEIARAVAALANGRPAEVPSPEDERGIDAILRLLRDEYSIDFSHYKASTVIRRIERRLALNRSLDIDSYVEQVRHDPRELSSLYEDLLIGVTRFFRDDAVFDILEEKVIPEVLDRAGDEQVRVWVPGCATGQEAYSIAMLLHEQFALRQRPVNLKILATDVHKASLEVAGAGLYSDDQLVGVSPDRLARFFSLKPNGYQISPTVRESIVFAPHNLIRDAPFTKLDLIACRNLLIYFQPHAQKTVLTLFHFALKPGGILFLGSSESPGGLVDEFDTIDEHAKIYRKRREVSLPRDLRLPLPRSTAKPIPAFTPRTVGPQLLSVYDRLLDRFMPPSFLVDDAGHLIDSFGGLETVLKVKGRRPSQNLLELLSGDFRTVVAGALHRVKQDAISVKYPDVQLPGHDRRYALVAEPVRNAHGTITHTLISLCPDESQEARALIPPFVDVPAQTHALSDGPSKTSTQLLSHDRIRVLEEELAYSKEHLQSALEEHEASNEELQATNEELIASNEELQSTNEELHSVNEELYTVNAEYQKKNVELQEANDDIEHLLTGTDVATLFLDRQLCIRKFTPRISEIFRVIQQDVGRPLRNFTHDLTHATLIADLERVLHDGSSVEAETWDKRGNAYFLRILPYRARNKDSSSTVPDGVVLTLTNITALVRARQEIADREERIRLLLDSTAEAILGIDLDGTCIFCNQACAKHLGYESPADLIGRQMHSLMHHTRPDGTAYLPEQSPILRSIHEREGIHVDDEVLWRSDGTSFPAEYWSHPIVRGDEVIGAVVTFLDVTERRAAEHEVQEGVKRREQFLAMLSHELRNPLAAILSATRLLDNEARLDNRCREATRVVDRQAKHMARLLDDLLDVSRITYGRITLRKEVVDVRETTRSAVEALGPLLAEHETKLEVDLPNDPLPVLGDPARLQQIQANLLSNASKYSPRGATVKLEVTCDGDAVVIRVSDKGRGISEDMLPKIFDLFVQSEQTIDRSEGGLGIGLTLLRSLVELHGGSVEARSDGSGKGSTFTVRLPLAHETVPAITVIPPGDGKVKSVVVVEDQADSRLMLQLLLESHGIEVHTAADGLEGAELIERLQPELALVDLGLPVMSGFDLARRIRGGGNGKATKLVALSGYGQGEDISAALQAGFDEHLTKPTDIAQLERLLGR